MKEVCENCKPLFEELLRKICSLEKRLMAYENAHTPPSLQKKKRIPRESSGKLGAPKGHPKYEREEPEITDTKKYSTEFCPHCKSKLGDCRETLRIVEEEIPDLKKLEVIEHLIECYKCENCGENIMSENNAPTERFGPNLQAHTTLLKHEDRLPFRKVAKTLDRNFGLILTHQGIMKIIRGVAKKLHEPYYDIIKIIRSSPVIYADETGYKMNGENWWLWTFVCDDAVLFIIRESRSKQVIEEVLGKEFEGVIVCDGWSAYPKFANKLQRCWAHVLRESYHLKENSKDCQKFHNQLKELFNELKEIRLNPPDVEERRELIKDMKRRMLSLSRRMKGYRHARTLAIKIKNGIDYWFTCVEYLEVEPTNNFAEQALRELIVQRKIMGGLRSEKGAETLEVVSTMLATWKKQNRPLLETLRSYV